MIHDLDGHVNRPDQIALLQSLQGVHTKASVIFRPIGGDPDLATHLAYAEQASTGPLLLNRLEVYHVTDASLLTASGLDIQFYKLNAKPAWALVLDSGGEVAYIQLAPGRRLVVGRMTVSPAKHQSARNAMNTAFINI